MRVAEAAARRSALARATGTPVLLLSAATGDGVQAALYALWAEIARVRTAAA